MSQQNYAIFPAGEDDSRWKSRTSFLSREPSRILVVEDEPLVRDVVKVTLEQVGFVVITASTGDEALSLVRFDYPFDALLTDVRMPGLKDGWALAEEAREWRPELPVVYMSAYHPAQRKVPRSIFLGKPYRPIMLLDALDKLGVRAPPTN